MIKPSLPHRENNYPALAVVERAAIAGRARARMRAADTLLASVSIAQLAKLDRLLTVDPTNRCGRISTTTRDWLAAA